MDEATTERVDLPGGSVLRRTGLIVGSGPDRHIFKVELTSDDIGALKAALAHPSPDAAIGGGFEVEGLRSRVDKIEGRALDRMEAVIAALRAENAALCRPAPVAGMTEELRRLSEAATPGRYVSGLTAVVEQHGTGMEVARGGGGRGQFKVSDKEARANAAFFCALVNAFRSGQLVAAPPVAPAPEPTAEAPGLTVEVIRLRATLFIYLTERCAYSYPEEYANPSPPEFGIEWGWQASTPERPDMMEVLVRDATQWVSDWLVDADPEHLGNFDREMVDHAEALGVEVPAAILARIKDSAGGRS